MNKKNYLTFIFSCKVLKLDFNLMLMLTTRRKLLEYIFLCAKNFVSLYYKLLNRYSNYE